jgi:hypothetical protein
VAAAESINAWRESFFATIFNYRRANGVESGEKNLISIFAHTPKLFDNFYHQQRQSAFPSAFSPIPIEVAAEWVI